MAVTNQDRLVRISTVLLVTLCLINSAIAAEGLYLRIFNALPYTVQIGREVPPRARLKTIEPGKEILASESYDYMYVERGMDGADPWVFNLRVQSFVSNKPLVLVLTKEGLYVVPADKFHPAGAEQLENIKAHAIGRILPLN